ncbi:MAG: GAF domain-containing protein [Candidatus Eisenbacteria bacterium]|nr:GAF domain-containing protein [Candidatus Eisenbacteria bacterium]
MHTGKATFHKGSWWKSRNARALGFGLAAAVLLVLAASRMDGLAWGGVGIMCAIGIATGLFSFQLDRRTTVTFGPAVYLGAVALFGGLVGVWVAAVSTLLVEIARFRRAPADIAIRVSIQVISVLAAAAAYMLAKGRIAPGGLSLADGGRFLLMFAAFAAVSGVLTASVDEPENRGLRRYFRWLSGRGVVVELAMLPLALLLVASYIPGEPATFPLLAVVLIISSAAGQKLWETQEAVVKRVNELKTLNTVSMALSCTLRLDDLVRLVHRLTREQLGAPVLAVSLYDEVTSQMETKACFADDCELPAWTTGVDDSCTGRVVAKRVPVYVPDTRRDGEQSVSQFFLDCAAERGLEIRSWVGVPLMADGRLIGVLSACSDRRHAFDAATHELFETLGGQVGKAVDNARLYEELKRARESAEGWNKKLEQSVEERTAELQEARSELEALNAELEKRVERRTKELRDVQQKIVESGRLAAVGELAAGLAHELNNPLGGVLGYTQYDLEKLKSTGEIVDAEMKQSLIQHMTFVERETQRCRQIVENLLKFSQTSRCATTEVNVNALVEETLGFTDRELASRGIEIRKELEETDLEVMADPRQLQQVFANIILNARKAMPSGGRLSVRSSRVQSPLDGSHSVSISFGDTGCGIAEEHLGRIFEPFFKTGPVGEGTGLGLSVSYGIVRDHGGNIEVESKVGVGSTFTVLLPLVGAADLQTTIQEAV